MKRSAVGVIASVLLAAWNVAAAPADSAAGYRIEARVAAPARYWDYSLVDSGSRRLYIGRSGGVLSLDLDTLRVTEPFVTGRLVHSVITLAGTQIGVATDGPADTLRVFDTQSRESVATVVVGTHPDTVAYDPENRTIVTVDKGSSDVTLVDATSWSVKSRVYVGGNLEGVVAAEGSLVYVAVADRAQIAAVDLISGQVAQRWALKGCTGPGGLAYDPEAKLLVVACGNRRVTFVALAGFTQVATLPCGAGADAVIVDSTRRRVFIPAGDDAVLDIFAIRSPREIEHIGRLATATGAKSGAVDPRDGKIYLPSGRELGEPAAGESWHPPRIAEESFRILVVAPPGAER